MVNQAQALLSERFGALSDPTRRAILDRLSGGSATVTELARPFDVSLPAISRHLRVLEAAGLIVRTRQGRAQVCTLVPDALRAPTQWLSRYERFWNVRLDRLEEMLFEEDEE